MTARKLSPDALPGWPRGLSADLAAAYVGVSKGKFLQEVDDKLWPEGTRRGGRVVWDRMELDQAFEKQKDKGPLPSSWKERLSRVREAEAR